MIQKFIARIFIRLFWWTSISRLSLAQLDAIFIYLGARLILGAGISKLRIAFVYAIRMLNVEEIAARIKTNNLLNTLTLGNRHHLLRTML